jgi:Fe-S oxidoreductase
MTEPAATQERKRRFTAAGFLLGLAFVLAGGTLALWWLGELFEDSSPEVGREVFGNIPTAVIVIFYVAVTAAVFIAAYLFAQRARNWGRGNADRRLGQWKERVVQLLRGLSMRTLMRDPVAGLMHSMIYWGFVILFLGTVTLEIDHILPEQFQFLEGRVYQGYSAILDLASLVFLGGLALAALARYGKRPWRTRSKTKPEDAWILAILAVIGLSGLATEAARIVVDGRPAFEVWSFVGYPLSFLVPETTAVVLHRIFWVAHVVAFGGFLVILPTTKLRHMFTSPANMFLSPRQRPKGAMRPVPNLMETDDIESVGAAEITEFTWKQLLDTDACTICGRCTSVCPAQLTGKPLDPREIVLKLGEVAALTGDPAVSPPVGIADGITVSSSSVFERIQPEEVWSCTSCKACDEICPVNIEILDKILDMRRHLSLMESDFPPELGKAYIAMENQSNPWAMSQQTRADWTASLDFEVRVLGSDGVESADYLYWVGCAGSFDDRNRTVTLSMARLMHHAGLDFAILGRRELCTGDPARRSGNEYVFQQLALQNIATLDEFGVRTVVTQCPHCFNTLANEYPQLGGTYEVIHHSQLLAELMRRGLVPTPDGDEEAITYHDPCYLGRHNDVYLPPRQVAASGAGGSLIEMPRSGNRAMCCGAGGARFWMEEHTGKKVNVERAEEAVATGASTVAVACPYCLVMIDDGVKEIGRDDVRVKDIATILAAALDRTPVPEPVD